MNRIAIHICSKDRATEIALLLESLRHQTVQDFNIYILDDASGTPLTNFYFITYMVHRLKMEGHKVKILRNEISNGIAKARQQLVEYNLKHGNEEYIVRIDDDSICDPKFLETLLEGIDAGYDLVGCTVPMFPGPENKRSTKEVKPIIGECRLNDKGELTMNHDDCAYQYLESEIIPTHHFRSSCLYKREMNENGVDYKCRLPKHSFREEQIFSFKAILKGYKLCIHTGSICWHMQAPSGGERTNISSAKQAADVFIDTTKKMFDDHGDFLQKYNDDNNLETREYHPDELLKNTNLVDKK